MGGALGSFMTISHPSAHMCLEQTARQLEKFYFSGEYQILEPIHLEKV
jgi:hypothetical protein